MQGKLNQIRHNAKKLTALIILLSFTTFASLAVITILLFAQNNDDEIKEVEKVVYVEVTPTNTEETTSNVETTESELQSVENYITLTNDGKKQFNHTDFSLIYLPGWDIKFYDEYGTWLTLTKDLPSGAYKFTALVSVADEIIPCKFADSNQEYFKIVGETSEGPIYAFSDILETNAFHDYSEVVYQEINTQNSKVRLVNLETNNNNINIFTTCENGYPNYFIANRGGLGLFTFEVPKDYDKSIYNEMVEIVKSYKSTIN